MATPPGTRQRLESQRALVLSRVDSYDLQNRSADRTAVHERGVQRSEAELRFALARPELVDEVEAALRRLARGSYGRCELCGVRIDEVRLVALPITAFCRGCAQ